MRGPLVLLVTICVLAIAARGDTGGFAAASLIIVREPGARISLSPARAINAVGEPHILTVHLETYNGAWWSSAPGEPVDLRIVSGAGWLSPGPYVTDANGEVRVILNSERVGVVVVEVEWEGIVRDEFFTASDTAEKEYIDVGARLVLTPDGEHPVGDPHDLVATLEIYEGPESGWQPAPNESVDITLPSGPGWLTSGPYVTDENGEIPLILNSDEVGLTDVLATWDGSVLGRPISLSDPAVVRWFDEEGEGAETPIDCRDRCPPPIPALYATKKSELLVDHDGDGLAGPRDTLRYTTLLSNFSHVTMDGVQYVEVVDPHTELVAGSWTTETGVFTIRDLGGTEVLLAEFGSIGPNVDVVFSFDVKINENLPETVDLITSQGTVYADTTAPIVTDDPSTEPIHDATWTRIGSAGGGGALFEEGSAVLLKSASVPDAEVLRVTRPGGVVGYVLDYRNDTGSELTDVRLVDVIGPHFFVQSTSSIAERVDVRSVGEMEFIIADFERLAPGETARLEYWTRSQALIPIEVSHTASRGLATNPSSATHLTDDPLTDLRGDATSVLFLYRCESDVGQTELEEARWTWDDWRRIIADAPTGIFPLVTEEKDGSEHLRWILYGGDFLGDLSVEPSTRPANWSEWAMVGLVDLAFEGAQRADPGFRLAQRDEPYVKAFLAEEPFFMWKDYDMPLYGRVPATDTGELLHCDGIASGLCDRAYLPLLVELDWSRDWDMRWLEDDLIVATVIPEAGLP